MIHLIFKLKINDKKFLHFIVGILLIFSIYISVGFLVIELLGKDFSISKIIGFILAVYLIYFDIRNTIFMTIRNYQNDEKHEIEKLFDYKEDFMSKLAVKCPNEKIYGVNGRIAHFKNGLEEIPKIEDDIDYIFFRKNSIRCKDIGRGLTAYYPDNYHYDKESGYSYKNRNIYIKNNKNGYISIEDYKYLDEISDYLD